MVKMGEAVREYCFKIEVPGEEWFIGIATVEVLLMVKMDKTK